MASYGNYNIHDTVKVNATGVRVRSTPNTSSNSNVLYTAAKNDTMYILSKQAVGDYYWYNVENKTQTTKPNGWMRGDYLTLVSGGSSSKFGFSSNSYVAFVNGTNVRVRPEPSTSSSSYQLTDLYARCELRLITSGGTAEQRESWVYLEKNFNNVTGYVKARYVGATPDSSAGTFKATYTLKHDKVNLRERPSSSGTVICQLAQGTLLGVLDNSRSDFYRVFTSNGIGWIAKSMLA